MTSAISTSISATPATLLRAFFFACAPLDEPGPRVLKAAKKEGALRFLSVSPPGDLDHVVRTISHRAGFPTLFREARVEKVDKNILQVAKEVVIKFIEVGRISPGNFGENFTLIYDAIQNTVSRNPGDGSDEDEEDRS
ncbi:MAG: hypothetical protein AB7E32_03435 [Desulfovibrio sp.]